MIIEAGFLVEVRKLNVFLVILYNLYFPVVVCLAGSSNVICNGNTQAISDAHKA